MKPLPFNLARTVKALERYDILDDKFMAEIDSCSQKVGVELMYQIEEAGANVGEAFGLDTQLINNVDDCRRLIRPGFKVPAAGVRLSFVRRMAELYKNSIDKQAQNRHALTMSETKEPVTDISFESFENPEINVYVDNGTTFAAVFFGKTSKAQLNIEIEADNEDEEFGKLLNLAKTFENCKLGFEDEEKGKRFGFWNN